MREEIQRLVTPTDGEVREFGGFSKKFSPTQDPDVLKVRFNNAMHGRGRTREVEGTGRMREEFCYWFYRVLEREGIRTHIADSIGGIKLEGDEALLDDCGILVKKLDMILLELIYRVVARGNWTDAHKFPVMQEGALLDPPAVEFCLKWKENVPNLDYQDLSPEWKAVHAALMNTPLGQILMSPTVERDDPRVGIDAAVAMNQAGIDGIRGRVIRSREEGVELEELTRRVNGILVEFMKEQGWQFEDGKFEVGRDSGGLIRVGDEYTQDSMRVRGRDGSSITKDLHRQMKSGQEIFDGYAKLMEAMKSWAK